MAFFDIRFPSDISYGAIGGPEFSTSMAISKNKIEQRNANWSTSRRRYIINCARSGREQMEQLIALFNLCRGRAHGFLYKDWSDYRCRNSHLGRGDGVIKAWQLKKLYRIGSMSYERIITKPVLGTVILAIDDRVINSGYQINYSTGQITFDSPLAQNKVLSASFNFDVP